VNGDHLHAGKKPRNHELVEAVFKGFQQQYYFLYIYHW